jgi:hypothetical protein
MTRAALAGALLTGYAWMTAGVAPFSAVSYVLVAIPVGAIVFSFAAWGGLTPHRQETRAYYQRKSAGESSSTVAPWIALLIAAVVLEVIGLLLGGRSTSVPTLSTTVDHLLAYRWERCLMCVAWLLTGIAPLIGMRHLHRARDM